MSKPGASWLEKHLRLITVEDKDAQDFLERGNGVCDDINPWALLKLISLRYLGSMYTVIMKKNLDRGYFNKICYVDLFSGSGISKIKNIDALYFGSPLVINGLDKKRQFTKMFLNDNNRDSNRALNSRLANIAQTKYIVTDEDANSRINEIASEIDYKCHSLIFIDPYSTEFSWKSMESVLNLNADIFFLYQTGQIARGIPVAKSPKAKIKIFFNDYKKVLEVFEDELEQNKPEALFKLYKDDVRVARGSKTLMESIRIKGVGFYYDMLFITKRTRGENPWFKAVIDLKKRIESHNSESVRRTLDIVLGKQAQLWRWG